MTERMYTLDPARGQTSKMDNEVYRYIHIHEDGDRTFDSYSKVKAAADHFRSCGYAAEVRITVWKKDDVVDPKNAADADKFYLNMED